ncbi:MAG: succinyldiaminopimelate transaminase [Pseudomonadota bacterium]
MNPDLDHLHPYPFEKLATLLGEPPGEPDPIPLSIGEPRNPAPAFVREALAGHLEMLARYPTTRGEPALRQAIAGWLTRRFGLPADAVDPERHCLPVAGTREALFALAQAVVDRHARPLVLLPNPFYQIYEGAALLAGAEPGYLPLGEDGRPDFDAVPDAVWDRCQLLYICTPGNPTGAVLDREQLTRLLERAERHDFIIASDECYAEIYAADGPAPEGLLGAAAAAGNTDFRRCVVFHSLSKRSNLPGLRSGFVAGDAEVLNAFLRYRTYHGCALGPPVQAASIAAWNDEGHVAANRADYQARFDAVLPILEPVLEVRRPDAGFYLWPRTPIDDTEFARRLFAEQHVTVLPGRYLGRERHGLDAGPNPGENRVRLALVAETERCVEAAHRVRAFIETL